MTPPEGESKGGSEPAALCTVHVRGTVLRYREVGPSCQIVLALSWLQNGISHVFRLKISATCWSEERKCVAEREKHGQA